MKARRVAVVVLGVLVAAACVRLGFWQLERLEERREGNARIRRGLRAAPVVLDGAPRSGAAYRRVAATGVYDGTGTVALYGRPLEGRPGDHVLTPLRFADGSAVLVDRGWLPIGGRADTPTGTVRVEGVLLPGEAPTGEVTAGGRVRSVDLDAIGSELPYPLAPVYLLLRDQEPPPARLPVPASPPELSEGPHLGYAVQWFSFAGVTLIGCAALLRREAQKDGPGDR